MRVRVVAWGIAVLTAVYLLFAGARAFVLIASGDPVPMLLGLSVIVIPIIGAWLLVRELTFGMHTQRLARILGSEGGLPVDDLPRTPSGRIDRQAADARFVEAESDVQGDPQDWRRWYRLAIAYDDARDRKRARAAMRRAIALARTDPTAA